MAEYKSRTLPPLRVSEKLRADVESVLVAGESLSAFVTDADSRSVDFRKVHKEFLARGLASAERSRETGDYVPAHKALAGLSKRLRRTQRTRK
jgi:hypothetical protein